MTDARGNSDDGDIGDIRDIGLVDVIRQVRADLAAAQRESEARGGDPRFAVGRVNLEMTVRVHREGTDGTGLRIGVVPAGRDGGGDGDGGGGGGATHRVQVELVPRHRGGTFHVGGEPCD